MGLNLAAAAWGCAEATLFFLVPDILLSAIAVTRGLRSALVASLWSVGGALCGGALMYGWARLDPVGALAAVGAVPAISAAQIDKVFAALEANGLGALLLAGFTGVPYKIFAVAASASGFAPIPFLAVSLLARLTRFAAVSALAAGIARGLAGYLSQRASLALLSAVWIAVYLAYFGLLTN